MPKPDETQPSNEPEEGGAGTPAPNDEVGRQAPPDEDEGLKDKHGEDAINRGRYDRDMKAKDDRIAELERQLEESGKKAKSGEDALKQIEALKAKLADEKVTHALEVAGCVNAKAAKALLDDYEGDVEKLKEACPYLFKKQTGSTGPSRAGRQAPRRSAASAPRRQSPGSSQLGGNHADNARHPDPVPHRVP